MPRASVLNAAMANATARALGHLPGVWRDWGVMKHAACTRCGAGMVERADDGKGCTGGMLDTKCKGGK